MSAVRSKPHALPVYESPAELRLRAWLQLVRVFGVMERVLAGDLASHDMTLPQFEVLATLRFGEGVTQKELAERLLVTKGNVCGLLDRLEAAGWVQRRGDEKDNRINRLHLTAAGRRKFDGTLPGHDRLILKAMKNLTDADVKHLRASLQVLERDASGA